MSKIKLIRLLVSFVTLGIVFLVNHAYEIFDDKYILIGAITGLLTSYYVSLKNDKK